MDHSVGRRDSGLFESRLDPPLLHLARSFRGVSCPTDVAKRAEILGRGLSADWQRAFILGGGFATLYALPPTNIEYAILSFADGGEAPSNVLTGVLAGQRVCGGRRLFDRRHRVILAPGTAPGFGEGRAPMALGEFLKAGWQG